MLGCRRRSSSNNSLSGAKNRYRRRTVSILPILTALQRPQGRCAVMTSVVETRYQTLDAGCKKQALRQNLRHLGIGKQQLIVELTIVRGKWCEIIPRGTKARVLISIVLTVAFSPWLGYIVSCRDRQLTLIIDPVGRTRLHGRTARRVHNDVQQKPSIRFENTTTRTRRTAAQ